MASHNATTDIPLEQVITHGSSTGVRRNHSDSSVTQNEQVAFAQMSNNEVTNEKTGIFHRGGRRRLKKLDSKGQPLGKKGYDGEEDTINRMGKIYYKILNFSIVTRYFIYVLPLALAIAIPIIIGATVARKAEIGGVRIVWLFTWVEIVWLSLWVSKIVAHFMPTLFQFLAGVVSSGTRKYALVIQKLEIPISLVGWSLVSLLTFTPLMLQNPDTRAAAAKGNDSAKSLRNWQTVLRQILAALMFSTLVLLAEKVLVQLISINYHRKQFNTKILESKRNIHLLGLLYDASRALFPMYCKEFAEEDYIINDTLGINSLGKKGKASGTHTPMRLIHDVGRFGDKLTSVFGNVASEITGKRVFDANSAHSIVLEALEKNTSSEALAKRLWMSFVVEGRDALYQEDIQEVLGLERQEEAIECFAGLDRDGNGDISLDEMILTVTEMSRERKSIATSMQDVDQAISVLDGLLATVVFIICIFIFVAFLNRNFTTTLATTGTALLSMSFVFAATCQEVLGSCIFLFVKHPYDVGDRVDISSEQLTVEHISLLFTCFKRVKDGRTVQIPNIVLNSLWVENISRSKAMREQIQMFVNFDTTFDDIKTLKSEMQAFVLDSENRRDFQPEIDVEVVGIAEMNKMELRIEIHHKSNWANETIRAARRSKFMCALVLAIRKIPLYGPGSGGASLGESGNPSFSVAVSPEQAQYFKDDFADKKDAKRLYPTKPTNQTTSPANQNTGVSTGTDYLGTGLAPRGEAAAVESLSARAPGVDPARDDAWNSRDDSSTLGERPSTDAQNLEEVKNMLRRDSTRGKRKAAGVASPGAESAYAASAQSMPTIAEPSAGAYNQRPPASGNPYAQPPYPAQSAPRMGPPGSGYAGALQHQHQQQQRQQGGYNQGPPPGNREWPQQ